MITIGGNVSVRNGNALDYCWREAVESLLPVCDTVTICDGCSDDGTWEEICAWAKRDPRIRTVQYAWPPKSIGTPEFWVDWLNYTREHIKDDYHLQLDADEVLGPDAAFLLARLKQTITPANQTVFQFERLNFWKDARHLAPHGALCGNRVIRFAPTSFWLPSDAPHPKAERAMSKVSPGVVRGHIFHYGFLRKREAFFEKAICCRSYFGNTQFINREDPRITEVRTKPGNWMEQIDGLDWKNDLIEFQGQHPQQMRKWLSERGFSP